jgi:hypothetical protein
VRLVAVVILASGCGLLGAYEERAEPDDAGSDRGPAKCSSDAFDTCDASCPEGWHIIALIAKTDCGDGRERTCLPNCGTFHQCSLYAPCPDGTAEVEVIKHADCELANYKDAAGNNARVCEVKE